ncbi:MAG: guanylate kinase [delta proteobacterium ML8_F1]|nr:MAG: guanylate kinase [delta proteobacterium ML8_F1]
MLRKGNLFVISGPSGAGKGTIIREVLKSTRDIKLSVSVTTRDSRRGETEGINYYFKSDEEFEKMISEEGFLEYAKVYDHYYGTPKEPVLKAVEQGENIILEIDIQGALQVKKSYPEAIFIFILPPSMAELKNRIVLRGSETAEALKLRFASALEEIAYIEKYDYYIVNDTLASSTRSLYAIIEAERCRIRKDVADIIKNFKEELQ